jgi:tetratricopeptide (TPR) repeat protein
MRPSADPCRACRTPCCEAVARARAAFARGRPVDAERAAGSVYSRGVYHGEILEILSWALEAQDRRPEAAPVLRELVLLRPDDPDLHLRHARALEAAGKRRLALTAAENATILAPRWPEAHLVRARLHEALGQPGPAREAFRAAASLAPESVEAHRGRGRLAAAPEEAEAAFARALALVAEPASRTGSGASPRTDSLAADRGAPDVPGQDLAAAILLELGTARLRFGRRREAVWALREARTRAPTIRPIHRRLALARAWHLPSWALGLSLAGWELVAATRPWAPASLPRDLAVLGLATTVVAAAGVTYARFRRFRRRELAVRPPTTAPRELPPTRGDAAPRSEPRPVTAAVEPRPAVSRFS